MRAILISLLFSSSAFAGFSNISQVKCDGEILSDTGVHRIFTDMKKGIIGIGTKDENCKEVNFRSVLIHTMSDINGEAQYLLMPADYFGRKSTCHEDIQPYTGPGFKSATLTKQSLQLSGTEDCEQLEFIIQE